MLERPSLLIDAAHHARELTTVSLVLYIMLRLLHGYVHGNQFYIDLLSENALFFVPTVNLDGV